MNASERAGRAVGDVRDVLDALRESEQRFRTIANLVPDLLWIKEPDGSAIWYNQRWTEYTGQQLDEALGSGWLDVVHPDDRPRAVAFFETEGQGAPAERDFRVRGRDGEYRWFLIRAEPALDDEGRIVQWFGAATDVHDQHVALETVRASEEQLRLVTDAMPALISYIDADQRFRFVNRAYTRWFGLERDDIVGRPVAAILGEHHGKVQASIDAALAGEMVRYDLVLPPDSRIDLGRGGSTRHFDTSYIPKIADDGVVEGFYSLAIDVTDRKRAEEAQRTLIGELQHRTRNLLAVVRSISSQTLRASTSLDEFARQFNDRLAALSRVQGLLSKGGGHVVGMRELVESELKAHGDGEVDERVRTEGPDIDLPSSTVQVLALALHELSTNAVKYGALAQDQARLSIKWALSRSDATSLVTLRWAERNVKLPPGQQGAKRGFGRQLIERALPYDLGAETCFSFAPDGIRCEIRVPLAD